MRCEFPLIPFHDSFDTARRDFQRRMNAQRRQRATGFGVYETDDSVSISLDVPGLSEDELSLTIQDGNLTVSGERKTNVPDGAVEVYANSAIGQFERTFRIEDSLDPASADAVVVNGVLTVTLNRRPELKPQKVNIRSSERPAE